VDVETVGQWKIINTDSFKGDFNKFRNVEKASELPRKFTRGHDGAVLRWQVGEDEKYAGRIGKMEHHPKDEPAIRLTWHRPLDAATHISIEMKLPRSSEDVFTYAHPDVLPSLQFTAGSRIIQYRILTPGGKKEVAKLAAMKTSKRLMVIKFSMRGGAQLYTAGFKWPGNVLPGKPQQLRDALPQIKASPTWTVYFEEDKHWFWLLRTLALTFAKRGAGFSLQHYTKGGVVE
jgi:hypothetical protein